MSEPTKEALLDKLAKDVFPPIAECLTCGHELPLGTWKDGTNIGVCEACRDLTLPNRGPCSPLRDCGCWHRSMQHEMNP